MKKKNAWLRRIAWGLLLVMCMNQIGTIALAAEPTIEKMETGQETLSEKEIISQEESPPGEKILSGTEGIPEAETIPQEEIPPQEEKLPENETLPEEDGSAEEGSVPEKESASEQQPAVSEPSPGVVETPAEPYEVKQDFNIDFYVIYEGGKLKLQTNGISGIKTWTQDLSWDFGGRSDLCV